MQITTIGLESALCPQLARADISRWTSISGCDPQRTKLVGNPTLGLIPDIPDQNELSHRNILHAIGYFLFHYRGGLLWKQSRPKVRPLDPSSASNIFRTFGAFCAVGRRMNPCCGFTFFRSWRRGPWVRSTSAPLPLLCPACRQPATRTARSIVSLQQCGVRSTWHAIGGSAGCRPILFQGCRSAQMSCAVAFCRATKRIG